MTFLLYVSESLFVKVSIKLQLMCIGSRDASLCVSLLSCRRHPVPETCRRRCHEHSSHASGHSTANRGLQVFPSIVPTITQILLMPVACIRVIGFLQLHTKISLITNFLKEVLDNLFSLKYGQLLCDRFLVIRFNV